MNLKIKFDLAKIVTTVISGLILTIAGAMAGVYINDKVQDNKIDTLVKSIDNLTVEFRNLRMEVKSASRK